VNGWTDGRCDAGYYCPEFGRQDANTVVVLRRHGPLPFSGRTVISLQAG
jgi:hypothetical protein